MLIIEEGFLSLNLGSVSYQILVDIFGGTGHVDLSLVVVLVKEVGKGSTMIKMGMSDDDQLDLRWIDFVEERETIRIFLVDHKSTVKHDFLLIDGKDKTGTADLATCP